MIKTLKEEYDVSLIKLTFTFNKRWYEKYDIFEYNNQKYICISRPRKNEDSTWSIDVSIANELKLIPDTKFVINNVSELYQ